MKVNNKLIKGIGFAFDGCHKLYIVATKSQWNKALQMGYNVCNLNGLQAAWNDSCPLRFISSWDLKTQYVKQNEQAVFEL